ncbi:MAG TPA: ROK family transcriptional regulator [Solirubrobacteraceae bacterium]|nr:ROK family transcriptional regulator [Solirubrobacteraceae bacterium]
MSAGGATAGSARPLLLRRLNEQSVLETIRSDGPVSRAEIARVAGISKPTVSLALKALLDAGLVRESADGVDGPTYGAIFFEEDPEAAAALGIDIGARYVRMALADVTGAVRAREDVEVKPGARGLLGRIPRLAERLVQEAGVRRERVACATVGVPGVVEAASGRVGLAENVPGLEGKAVASILRERLELPVEVFNDVNLAALGERDSGAGRGVESFVFVSVGTGLGAGVVIGGELVAGSHGAAGELDLMRPAGSGDDPSAHAILEYAGSLAGARRGRAPWHDTVDIFARAREGDGRALRVVDEVARRIAAHVIPIAAVVDPGLVILGGGIGSNGDLLLDPLRAILARALPYPPALTTSELGRDAVLGGALALGLVQARDWSFAKRP